MPPNPGSSKSDESGPRLEPKKHKGVGDEHPTPIPAHVNVVKDGLLDFNRFIGLEAVLQVLGTEDCDGDDGSIPLKALKADADNTRPSQRLQDREFLENAQQLSRDAERLESGFAEDSDWRRLFRIAIKHRMDEAYSPVSILPSTIVCAENEAWDTNSEPSRDLQTRPKPDLCFGFPIHNENYLRHSSFRNDPFRQQYTINTLSRLAMNGLRSTPISASLAGAGKIKRHDKAAHSQSLCFPWCVVQLKKPEPMASTADNEKSMEDTFHHASLAASDALFLLEKLARFADVKQDGQHIPPVIAITSVGAKTTIWLTFSQIVDDQYRSHKMLSIWNGCVSKIWDAIQFCRIMDNIFVWSQQILRPKVTQYIDQWKLRYNPKVPNQHSQLEKDPETADLIHRIQDRMSSLSVLPSSTLPELIQQAVVLQEVMRTNPPNPGPPSIERLILNAQEEMKSSRDVSAHPALDNSLAGASSDSTLNGAVLKDHQSKEKEDKKQGDHNKDCSPKLQDKLPILGSLLKTNTLALDDPRLRSRVFADARSIATKFEQEPDFKGKSSIPNTNTIVPGPSKNLPTSKHSSKPGSYVESGTREKGNNGITFTHSYKFKTSDFEFNQDRSVLQPRKSQSADVSASSAQPNPFKSSSFQLSFDVQQWWEILLAPPTLQLARDENAGSQVPIYARPSIEIDDLYDPQRHYLRDRLTKRKNTGRQQAEVSTVPTLDVKIPWRGKSIRVKLPPAKVCNPMPSYEDAQEASRGSRIIKTPEAKANERLRRLGVVIPGEDAPPPTSPDVRY